jgi:hypothetical protein
METADPLKAAQVAMVEAVEEAVNQTLELEDKIAVMVMRMMLEQYLICLEFWLAEPEYHH